MISDHIYIYEPKKTGRKILLRLEDMKKHVAKRAQTQVRLAARIVRKEPSLGSSFQWAGPRAKKERLRLGGFSCPDQ